MTSEEYNELIVAAHLDQFEVNMAIGLVYLIVKVESGDEEFLSYEKQWVEGFQRMTTLYRTSPDVHLIFEEMEKVLDLSVTIDRAVTFPVSFEKLTRASCLQLLTIMLNALEQKG